jgi:hypothetical protein
MDYLSRAVLQPLSTGTVKQQSNEPTGVVLGLETGLPDNLYKMQRCLIIYHDRVEYEVELVMREFSVSIMYMHLY